MRWTSRIFQIDKSKRLIKRLDTNQMKEVVNLQDDTRKLAVYYFAMQAHNIK